MQLTGLARLGRDTEIKYMADGTAVCNLSLAYNYGRKGQDGKRPTQWVEAALFGKLAETLVEYLTKGTQVCVDLNEVHIETFTTKEGKESAKLKGRVMQIELAGSRNDRAAEPDTKQAQESKKPAPAAAMNSPSVAELQDDIPF